MMGDSKLLHSVEKHSLTKLKKKNTQTHCCTFSLRDWHKDEEFGRSLSREKRYFSSSMCLRQFLNSFLLVKPRRLNQIKAGVAFWLDHFKTNNFFFHSRSFTECFGPFSCCIRQPLLSFSSGTVVLTFSFKSHIALFFFIHCLVTCNKSSRPWDSTALPAMTLSPQWPWLYLDEVLQLVWSTFFFLQKQCCFWTVQNIEKCSVCVCVLPLFLGICFSVNRCTKRLVNCSDLSLFHILFRISRFWAFLLFLWSCRINSLCNRPEFPPSQ